MCRELVLHAALRATPELARLLEPVEILPRGPCPRCEGRGSLRGTTCTLCEGARVAGETVKPSELLFAVDGRGLARQIEIAKRGVGDALHRAHAPVCAARAASHATAA